MVAVVAVGFAVAINFAMELQLAVARPARSTPIGSIDVVRTRRLEVIDSADAVVAKIADQSGSGGQLWLFGSRGKSEVRLAAHEGYSVLDLQGDNGNMTIANGWLALYDSNFDEALKNAQSEEASDAITQKHRRVSLSKMNDGGGSVRVFNPHGKVAAEMQCSKANDGLIMVNDFDGKPKQSLSGQ
jgi:hypothetical protein